MQPRIAIPLPDLFAASRAEQTARARERYFEEGLLPSGLVSDAVYESWARCQRLHDNPGRKVTFEPVSVSRAQLALQRNRSLHQAWLLELPQLQAVLGATSCAAMLTDGTGVLIGATCVGRPHERLMPVATRTGVNLSEEAVGTTAPGVAARTGQPVLVLGAEHFFSEVGEMHCAAAPIRNTRGELAGVLDISSEKIPFGFDAAAVVGVYAGALENRLLITEAREHLVLRFQVTETLIDSPAVCLVGLDASGRIAWRNGAAARLLGLPTATAPVRPIAAEEGMGMRFCDLASLPRSRAGVLQLPNGLVVWARAEMRASDGLHGAVHIGAISQPSGHEPPMPPAGSTERQSAAAPPAAQSSLRACSRELVVRTLQEFGGNVSKAAQKLDVSRGLIYRRLREQGERH